MKNTSGGAFLVIGTTVGAGMLSLPLITAACGLGTALVLLLLSWSVMYLTSLKLLKACEQHKEGVNLTTLIQKKMPFVFQLAFIIIYLLLLYALMSAYTTQGASFIQAMGQHYTSSTTAVNSHASSQALITTAISAIIFIAIFGSIILNTKFSDYLNRCFISLKLIFFIACLCAMYPFLEWSFATSKPLSIAAILFAWPTLLPSFGFQNIVPVLYEYQKGNISAIKRSVLFGSLAVLVIYIVWIAATLSILPQISGSDSYKHLFFSGNNLDLLMQLILHKTSSDYIALFLSIFMNVSIITSFICVGLSLFHYIKDTFKRFHINLSSFLALILTFIVPYFFTVIYPDGFILALQYAAIFAVIVFVYTPIYLDEGRRYKLESLYPLTLGTLVIICEVLNLTHIISPFL